MQRMLKLKITMAGALVRIQVTKLNQLGANCDFSMCVIAESNYFQCSIG